MLEKSIDDAMNVEGMPFRNVAIVVAGMSSVTEPPTMWPSRAGWVDELAT